MAVNSRRVRRLATRTHGGLGLVVSALLILTCGTGILLEFPQLLGPPPTEPRAFAVDPVAGGKWWRGSTHGLEYSTNTGESWSEAVMLRPPGSIIRITYAPDKPQTLYVLGSERLVFSRDRGRVWEPLEPPRPSGENWYSHLDLAVGRQGEVLLLTAAGLLYSKDAGQSWVSLPQSDDVSRLSLYALVHDLHTGRRLGTLGGWVISAVAVAAVLLVCTGIVLVFSRSGRKERTAPRTLADVRWLLIVGLPALLLSCLLARRASAVGPDEPILTSHEEARLVMGTLARVRATATSKAISKRAASAALAVFEEVDSRLSTWRPDSELSKVNATAQLYSIQVAPSTYSVIDEALSMARQSRGAFDPTVLPLVKLWGFRSENPAPAPNGDLLRATLSTIDYRLVAMDPTDRSVRFCAPGVQLDLGGIAKGHALELAADAMKAEGVCAGMLDLGGGIYVFSGGADELIGIIDPRGSSVPLLAVELAEGAVATSGQYERSRSDGNQTWGHVIDPRNGLPCEDLLSVTIISRKAMLADATATACLVLGLDEGLTLVESLPDCEVIFIAPGRSSLEVVMSSGLEGVPIRLKDSW